MVPNQYPPAQMECDVSSSPASEISGLAEASHVELKSTRYKPYRPMSSGHGQNEPMMPISQTVSLPAKDSPAIRAPTQLGLSNMEPNQVGSLEPTSFELDTGYSHQPATIQVEPTQSHQGAPESQAFGPVTTELGTMTEYKILLFGATGSGKSSFIRATSGCEVKVGHDIISCT